MSHNYWHLALFYIEKGDYEEALGVYDQVLAIRALEAKECRYGIVDTTALLYRLEMEGINRIE